MKTLLNVGMMILLATGIFGWLIWRRIASIFASKGDPHA